MGSTTAKSFVAWDSPAVANEKPGRCRAFLSCKRTRFINRHLCFLATQRPDVYGQPVNTELFDNLIELLEFDRFGDIAISTQTITVDSSPVFVRSGKPGGGEPFQAWSTFLQRITKENSCGISFQRSPVSFCSSYNFGLTILTHSIRSLSCASSSPDSSSFP